jgi:shikimate 5-dehydrogenase
VLLAGAGGVARAIAAAAHDLGARLTITARKSEQADALAAQYGATTIPWEERSSHRAYLFINGTPIGMTPDDGVVLDTFDHVDVVADLVAKPAISKMITLARKAGRRTIAGSDFVLQQALHQFTLYTGREAPDVMAQELQKLL